MSINREEIVTLLKVSRQREAGDNHDALISLTNELTYFPESELLKTAKAEVLNTLGDKEFTLYYLKKSITENKKSSSLHRAMAFMRFKMGRRKSKTGAGVLDSIRGFSALEKARKLDKSFPRYIDMGTL